jgi:hypothetical protein
VNRTATTIVDKKTGEPIEATLIQGVTKDMVIATELKWQPVRTAAAQRLHAKGELIPEHWHWDWIKKSNTPDFALLASECFGIECENEIQGLMLVNTSKYAARLDPDETKPLIYVDYLESAPTNVKGIATEPRFGAVGVRLFEAAVQFSNAEGFGGRTGLHALPQAEHFYENVCQMTRVEQDKNPPVTGLWWFELTAAGSHAFLSHEGDA